MTCTALKWVSRVAITLCTMVAIGTTATACSEEGETSSTLAPPSSYTTEQLAKFTNPASGRYYCGASYDVDKTVAVSVSSTAHAAYGMSMQLVASGSELIVEVAYTADTHVAAFIVQTGGFDSQSFLVPVPASQQRGTEFRFDAREVSMGTADNLTAVSACPRHTGDN